MDVNGYVTSALMGAFGGAVIGVAGYYGANKDKPQAFDVKKIGMTVVIAAGAGVLYALGNNEPSFWTTPAFAATIEVMINRVK